MAKTWMPYNTLIHKHIMTTRAEKIVDAAHRVSDGGVPLGKLIREGKNPMISRVNYEYAAILRAAVDYAAPDDAVEPRNYLPMAIECQRIRQEFLTIANELENL